MIRAARTALALLQVGLGVTEVSEDVPASVNELGFLLTQGLGNFPQILRAARIQPMGAATGLIQASGYLARKPGEKSHERPTETIRHVLLAGFRVVAVYRTVAGSGRSRTGTGRRPNSIGVFVTPLASPPTQAARVVASCRLYPPSSRGFHRHPPPDLASIPC